MFTNLKIMIIIILILYNYFLVSSTKEQQPDDKIYLNGKWNYIIDQQEIGYYNTFNEIRKDTFFSNRNNSIEYNFNHAPEIDIPSDWNTKIPGLLFYEGTVWFKKSFDYKIKPDRKVFIFFEAINYEAIVYLNGEFVGSHEGGFTRFKFDITRYLKEKDNYLIVKVDNKRKYQNVPSNHFDWWNYGGITRDVYMVETDKIYIKEYSFELDKDNNNTINLYIELNEKTKGKTVEIKISELGINKMYRTNKNGKIFGKIITNKISYWSPESPKLYDIELKIGKDTIKDKIGFRTIQTSNKEILLNGKPIFLRGVCIHEEKLEGEGRANSIEDAKKILKIVKELGCNYMRLAHYPHNENMIKEAEKMGIMVWSEIPVYWKLDFENKSTLENAKNQLQEMIKRDINRANVIIWSIGNENPIIEGRNEFLIELATLAKTLDKSRLISMAMQVKRVDKYKKVLEDKLAHYVDVISINQYVEWYIDFGLSDKMEFSIPFNKPIIASEFGGGAKYGLHGDKTERWTEEFQENVYIKNLKMLDKIDGLAGASAWLLKDFRSPIRVLSGIQDFYNRKGIVSEIGEKKKAFYILQNWYAKKKKEYE